MSRSQTWTVLPVKSLAHVKQRLAGVLPLEARRKLVLLMLHDVLAVLKDTPACQPVVVVTPDPEVAEIAMHHRAAVLREDEGRGHTSAAAAGFAYAKAHGAVRALTIPADIPLITPADLERVIAAATEHPEPALTMVPSHDRDGTNAMVVSPPDAFVPSFGPASFQRHLREAEARGLSCRVLDVRTIGMDTDEPADLARLIAAKAGDGRYGFLDAYRARLTETMEKV